MEISIHLNTETPGELEKFFDLFTGFGKDKPVVIKPAAIEFISEAAEPEPAQATESAPEPTRRIRRTKAEIEAAKAAEAAPEPTPQAAPSAATTLPPATEQPTVSVSIDDLRAALQGYTSAKGMPAGIELLKKFGCSRVSELAAKDDAEKQGFIKEATV
jgi:hypothetical protein